MLQQIQDALTKHNKKAFIVAIAVKEQHFIAQILDPLGKQYFHYVFNKGEENSMITSLLNVLSFDPHSDERGKKKNNQGAN